MDPSLLLCLAATQWQAAQGRMTGYAPLPHVEKQCLFTGSEGGYLGFTIHKWRCVRGEDQIATSDDHKRTTTDLPSPGKTCPGPREEPTTLFHVMFPCHLRYEVSRETKTWWFGRLASPWT